MQTVTVGAIIEGAFRLLRERPGAFVIWFFVYLLIGIGTSFATVWILDGQLAAVADGATEADVRGAILLQFMLVGIVSILFTTIVYAAMLRAMLRPEEGGPGFLRIGMDEARLFFLTLLFMIILGIGAFFGMLGFGFAVGGASPESQQIGMIIYFAVLAVAVGYFFTKLSLSLPLTFLQRRFEVGEGWALTKGHFWTLLAAYLILVIIVIAVSLIASLATEQEYFTAIAQGGFTSAEADQVALRDYYLLSSGTIDAMMIVRWVVQAALGAFSLALLSGAAATATQELVADQERLDQTFS